MTDKHVDDDTEHAATEADEAAMDRAAQAGVGGAFDAVDDEQTRAELIEDAKEAFGEQQ